MAYAPSGRRLSVILTQQSCVVSKLAGSPASVTGSRGDPPDGGFGPCAQAAASAAASATLLKRGKALEVEVRVAELLRDHREAAEGVADLELLAHAHAAVQLHRLLADVARVVGDLDLRGGDRARPVVLVRRKIEFRA